MNPSGQPESPPDAESEPLQLPARSTAPVVLHLQVGTGSRLSESHSMVRLCSWAKGFRIPSPSASLNGLPAGCGKSIRQPRFRPNLG